MRYEYLILATLFLLGSCGKEDLSSVQLYRYMENSQISAVEMNEFTLANIVAGNHTVFDYQFIMDRDRDPNVIDDEYFERIIFEIAPDIQEFHLQDQDLANAQTYFSCTCPVVGSLFISQGEIIGIKRPDQSWEISIDITFTMSATETSRSLVGIFTPK